jgi:alkanesulfonate monooxygenase SsuD/methylene tetrahydromethanopterin reductase-like flavin-dependent oxidoreductase (luciferase family)
MAAIVAAAEATTTLRVGSYVFANDFRHPVMLAKEAATIDLLSNGRFEFGIVLSTLWHISSLQFDLVGRLY